MVQCGAEVQQLAVVALVRVGLDQRVAGGHGLEDAVQLRIGQVAQRVLLCTQEADHALARQRPVGGQHVRILAGDVQDGAPDVVSLGRRTITPGVGRIGVQQADHPHAGVARLKLAGDFLRQDAAGGPPQQVMGAVGLHLQDKVGIVRGQSTQAGIARLLARQGWGLQADHRAVA